MAVQADGAQLRNFGLIMGAIFAALGLWPTIIRGGDPVLWALGLAGAFILPALTVPRTLRVTHRAWMAFAGALGWANTRLVLGLIFFGLITPMALVMRLAKRDPMQRGFDPVVSTYRVPSRPRPGVHMMRQF